MISTIKVMITVFIISNKPFMLTVRKNNIQNENTILKMKIDTLDDK